MNIAGIAASAAFKALQATDNTEESAEEAIPQEEAQETSSSDSFADALSKMLGKSMEDSVNEEELFAVGIEHALGESNPEAATYYREQKDRLMTEMARADGYVSVEDVANAALNATVEAGHIDQDSASTVRSSAFRAAQLDSNLNALYDGRGSEGDSTVATATMAEAMVKMSTALEQLAAGEIDAETPTEVGDQINTPQELDGADGFLWKPVSESDGKLVVLLPTDLREMIERVEIHSSLPATAETLLAEGRFTGDDHNGDRPHYRFDEEGAAYGENAQLVAYKTDGTSISWSIANGAERQD